MWPLFWAAPPLLGSLGVSDGKHDRILSCEHWEVADRLEAATHVRCLAPAPIAPAQKHDVGSVVAIAALDQPRACAEDQVGARCMPLRLGPNRW